MDPSVPLKGAKDLSNYGWAMRLSSHYSFASFYTARYVRRDTRGAVRAGIFVTLLLMVVFLSLFLLFRSFVRFSFCPMGMIAWFSVYGRAGEALLLTSVRSRWPVGSRGML